MKRAIAGLLLLVGMSVAPALAWDGNRGLRRDIRHDDARIAHDRHELRRDVYRGNYAGARHERRELRHEYRDVNRDRRELAIFCYRERLDEPECHLDGYRWDDRPAHRTLHRA